MQKLAVNKYLLVTAMMASSLSYGETEAGDVSTDNITAMDGTTELQTGSLVNDDLGLSSELWGEMDIPVLLTAARLRQSQLDAPASVTVIDAETIQALGFKDIEEIFRLVPGMLVAYHSGVGEKTASVAYHGTNLPEHRRLQVLIDGRSVYKPGLARVEWSDIPLAIEDIARIEIIRGPNSAAYGANSYLGVINIMTKHPQSEKGVILKVTGGMRDVQNTYVNMSDSIGNTELRWTLGSKQKSGFDVDSNGNENRDGIEAVYTTLSTFTPLSSHLNMELKAGYKKGNDEQRELLGGVEGELEYISDESAEDIYAQDIFIFSKVNIDISQSQFSHLQFYSQKFIRETDWLACLSDYYITQVATGAPKICGEFNKDLTEIKSEIEYQHTSQWDNNLRTVAGLRLRLDEFNSETYNGGYSSNLNKSAFTNIEYKLNKVSINVGGMYESDDLIGSSFSPRFAFNFHLSQTDTLRFIHSKATRSPDLFEQGGKWVFTVRDAYIFSGPSLGMIDLEVAEAAGGLQQEKITSNEISYFGVFPEINAQIDIKLFNDDLSSLISEGLGHTQKLTNSNRIKQTGIEGQLKVRLNESDNIALSFAYVDVKDDFEGNTSYISQEGSLSADRSGSLSWIHNISPQTVLGSAYYHVENWNTSGDDLFYTFSRLDMNISHTLNVSQDYALTLQGAVQYRFDDDPLGRNRNFYSDDHFIYGSAQLKF